MEFSLQVETIIIRDCESILYMCPLTEDRLPIISTQNSNSVTIQFSARLNPSCICRGISPICNIIPHFLVDMPLHLQNYLKMGEIPRQN